MIVNLTLPWPPSANRYWRNVNGRTLVSKEARVYKSTVKKLSLLSEKTCMSGKLSLTIHAYCPDKRKRDIDNLIKIVTDSLQEAGYFENDCQIDKLYIERMPIIMPKGSLYVELREL
jgi:crossover junction endodeoxyribonuclease RusA